MKKFFYSIFLISILFFPVISLALELQYPEVNIPPFGKTTLSIDMDLGKLIAWLYYFIIGISGFAAFLMIIFGGVQWLTSVGNPSQMGAAKDRITSALLGIVIILASWLILNTINPNLTTIKMPGLCGDRNCDSSESCSSCPVDCGACSP